MSGLLWSSLVSSARPRDLFVDRRRRRAPVIAWDRVVDATPPRCLTCHRGRAPVGNRTRRPCQRSGRGPARLPLAECRAETPVREHERAKSTCPQCAPATDGISIRSSRVGTRTKNISNTYHHRETGSGLSRVIALRNEVLPGMTTKCFRSEPKQLPAFWS